MNAITADDYGWKSKEHEHSHSYLLPTCMDVLRKHSIQALLDIGTGNGAALPSWLSLGIDVSAIEPDEKGFFYASQNQQADVRKIALGEQLPCEWKEAFDAVISLEVIEHLFDPFQLVKAASDVLKKGGIAIISTPYHGYLKNLALAIGNKWDFHHHPRRVGGHIKFWSRASLTSLFEEGGFKEHSFFGVGRLPYLWKSMIIVYQKD